MCEIIGADEGSCRGHDPALSAWSGEWPGAAECRRRGWWTVFTPDGWRECTPDTEGACEDLTRLSVFQQSGIDDLYQAQ